MMESSKERKARLLAMRQQAASEEGGNGEQASKKAKDESEEPVLKFRNYTPASSNVSTIAEVKKENPEEMVTPSTKLQDQVEMALMEAEEQDVLRDVHSSTIEDVINLAPRKVDWDLKRNIEEKMNLLQKKTNRAIAHLIQERLKNQAEREKFELAQQKANTQTV
eukprot:m.77815 g.77815  ORF g.77815 m.77815 type:complete len:165 (+) comp11930_c0_seq1:24-518(+)